MKLPIQFELQKPLTKNRLIAILLLIVVLVIGQYLFDYLSRLNFLRKTEDTDSFILSPKAKEVLIEKMSAPTERRNILSDEEKEELLKKMRGE